MFQLSRPSEFINSKFITKNLNPNHKRLALTNKNYAIDFNLQFMWRRTEVALRN